MTTVTAIPSVIDSDLHLAVRARQLALNYLVPSVEAGLTEDEIAYGLDRRTGQARYFNGRQTPWGQHDVAVVAAGRVARGKRVATHKVMVYEVHGERINIAFNLHELYLELKNSGEQPLLWE